MSRTATTERTRQLHPPPRYDFAGTVGAIAMGRNDPCARIAAGSFWLALRTPEGPATLSLTKQAGELIAVGYGPGADWIVERSDAIAGLRDDVTGFPEVAARHPVVAELARVHSGHRLAATGRVFPRLLRAVLEQKVTGTEAYRSYLGIVRHFHIRAGKQPAPGPIAALLLPPDPAAVAATPYWAFHPFGVEQRRADALCRGAAEATRLEQCPDAASLTTRLISLRGIGDWTAAEVVRTVFGDPDAVSVGDFHTPHLVSWALAGEPRAGSRDAGPDAVAGSLSPADRRMLELLEPFRGQRGRVCVLIERGGSRAPRFGPRLPIRSFASS